MANNRLNFSSLAELKKLAESYKTKVLPFLEKREDPAYTIADISKEEFDNISTFLLNAVIKDSRIIEIAENEFSLEFSSYLKKYFDDSLSLEDIVKLKRFVNKYNEIAFTYMYNNIFFHVFGVNSQVQGIDKNGFFGKLTTNIKERVRYLVENYPNQTQRKTAAEWFGSANVVGVDATFTAREFYNSYFLKSNITEAIVLLTIISYLNDNDGGAGLFTVSNNIVSRNSNLTFRKEDYFDLTKIKIDTKDFIFSNEIASIDFLAEANKRILQSLIIKDSSNRIVLSVPFKLLNGTNPVPEEIYNFLNLSGNDITYDNLFTGLRTNFLAFIDLIKQTTTDNTYNSNLNYFVDGSNRAFVSNITADIKEVAKIFYTKDLISENFYITSTEEPKNSANLFELSLAQSMEHLTFIDVKGIDFSQSDYLNEARELFFTNLGAVIIDETTIINKLTYTILYKELNPALRRMCLSDVQEYIFARLFASLNYNKSLVFETNKKGVSFFDTLNSSYRTYRERKEIFFIDSAFNRYKFFYNNIYMTRISEESDIVGYYVGDGTAESAFTNNYGFIDYQKVEITNFLDIYKTTRDYYYKVLLNKSFLFDDAYSLYEKLLISWIAIERFLTSKIENLKDPEYYNSNDIFNFLESYGLGILNQFNFFLGSKDYKVSIIKNFTNLIKLKGSKDVIELLLRIFDIGDTTIEIDKFLLVDQVTKLYLESSSIKLSTITNSSKRYIAIGENPTGTGTGILIFDPIRIYYQGGSFKRADGTAVTVSTTYVFDEENYKLYTRSGNVLTEKAFTFTDRIPTSLALGVVVYNELNEIFYIGTSTTPSTITSITRVSVVDTLPRTTISRNILNGTRGDIYMISSSLTFFEKVNSGWERLKVSDYYPEVIKNNIGVNLTGNSSLSKTLEKYNNYLFYIKNSVTNEVELYEYIYFTNTLARINFTSVLSLPKEPGVIDVPFWRVLIKTGTITRYEYENFTPMIYKLKTDSEFSNRTLLEINNYVNNYFGTDFATVNILIQPKSVLESSKLKFIEVPYSSENGTREILNRIDSSTEYIPFLEKSETEKNDIYWTKENVPEETLKDIGLDAVETKYLSLTISENIYRRYAISRYILSAIEYLEGKFIITGEDGSVVSRIKIDSGSGLFGEVSLYDFFQAVKIQYKALLKMYEVQIGENPSVNISNTFKRYYGINASYDWSSLEDYLTSKINDFNSISSEFLTDLYKVGSDSPISYDKFNLYEKTNEYISFGTDRQYRKDVVVLNTKELNDVSKVLKSSLFSTHKVNKDISQENSGEFVLNLFEDLNTIRIEDGDNLWNYFLSKYYDNDYSPTNIELLQTQIANVLPDKSELYFKIIEKMILFPIQYFDGLLNQSYINENVNLNKDFVEFAELIFKDVYTVEANENDQDPAFFIKTEFEEDSQIESFLSEPLSILDNTFIYPTDDEELEELISEASERLFLTIDSLSSIFAAEQFMQFSFSLKENERRTLGFVETAIKLFLSYTSQLYSSSFRRTYNTISETPPLSERVIHTLETRRLDTVFYDEKLDIREE